MPAPNFQLAVHHAALRRGVLGITQEGKWVYRLQPALNQPLDLFRWSCERVAEAIEEVAADPPAEADAVSGPVDWDVVVGYADRLSARPGERVTGDGLGRGRGRGGGRATAGTGPRGRLARTRGAGAAAGGAHRDVRGGRGRRLARRRRPAHRLNLDLACAGHPVGRAPRAGRRAGTAPRAGRWCSTPTAGPASRSPPAADVDRAVCELALPLDRWCRIAGRLRPRRGHGVGGALRRRGAGPARIGARQRARGRAGRHSRAGAAGRRAPRSNRPGRVAPRRQAGGAPVGRGRSGGRASSSGPPVRKPGWSTGRAAAVTGRRWSGDVHDWRAAPDQYAAMHFHADAVDDLGWEPTLDVALPDELESGVYAVVLSAGGPRGRGPVRRPGAALRSERRCCCRASPTSPTPASATPPRARSRARGPLGRAPAPELAVRPPRRTGSASTRRQPAAPADPAAARLSLSAARRASRAGPGPGAARVPRAPRNRLRGADRSRPARRGTRRAGGQADGRHRRPPRVRDARARRGARGPRRRRRVARVPRRQRPQRPRLDRPGASTRRRAEAQRDPGPGLAGAPGRAPPCRHRRLRRRLAPPGASGARVPRRRAVGVRRGSRCGRTSAPTSTTRRPRSSSTESSRGAAIGASGAVLGGAAGFEVDNHDPLLGSPADAVVLASAPVGDEYDVWPDDVRDGPAAAAEAPRRHGRPPGRGRRDGVLGRLDRLDRVPRRRRLQPGRAGDRERAARARSRAAVQGCADG